MCVESKKILLVVVLYKCSLYDTKTYQTIIQSTHGYCIYVYDNSPERQSISDNNVVYVHDATNGGLSIAYNSAAKFAQSNGYEWLLLLDQDTDFSGLTIDDYVKAINENSHIKIFAPKVKCSEDKYMSPVKVWHRMGRWPKKVPDGIVPLSKYAIINSGMCVNIDAMIKCGGYNEKVFLDHSDFEFLERFRKEHPVAHILDKEIEQRLSFFSDDKNTTIHRYKLFCRSIKGCEKRNIIDSFWLFIFVLKRGLSVTLRLKTLKPIGIFYRDYCCY